MNYSSRSAFSILIVFLLMPIASIAQQNGIDAKTIASTYYKGVVKILLFDSAAEKNAEGSGYISRGSGFIVSEDGFIFTNKHVIDFCVMGYINYDYYNEQTGNINSYAEPYLEYLLKDSNIVKINRAGHPVPIVQVYTGTGENDYVLYNAKVLSLSLGSFDGAVLKIVSDINGNPVNTLFEPVPLGNSDSTLQGEDLCIFGFPAQYDGSFNLMLKDMSTLTFGKHSGFDHVFNKDFGYIKTDAAINSGNSGGPVFGQNNKVIGIATATGNKTSIGLVGGINGMYYVVAPNLDLLQKLVSRGLKVPRNSGAVNTITGEKMAVPSQTDITIFNKKKEAYWELRKEREKKLKENELYKEYSSVMRPKIKFNLGAAGGISSYSRGNLDIFWQTINKDASISATGNGSPFWWNAEFQILFSDKKEKNFCGFGYGLAMTSKHAIGAVHTYENALNEISLGARFINFDFIFSHSINDKLFLFLYPGFSLGNMNGAITVYGNTYTEKSADNFGSYVAGGINYKVGKFFAVTVRGGYRGMIIQETHEDSRGGYSLTKSFFADDNNDKTTQIKWSGAFVSTGIAFSNMGVKTKKRNN